MDVLDNENAIAQRKNHKSNSDIKADCLVNQIAYDINPYAKV